MVSDAGEVKVNSKGKYYATVLGTGHDRVFAFMSFAETIIKATKNEKSLLLIKLFGDILDNILSVNDFVENYDVGFYKSTENFSNSCKLIYEVESFNKFKKSLIEYLPHVNQISKTYYILKDENIYFLYNSAFHIHVLCNILTKLSNGQDTMIPFHGIFSTLFSCYAIGPEREGIMPLAFIVDSAFKCLYDNLSLFFNCDDNKAVLLIPETSLKTYGKNVVT